MAAKKKPIQVGYLTLEMMHPHLPPQVRDWNQKGGLGKLAGDEGGGWPDIPGVECRVYTPLYRSAWFNKELNLDYDVVLGKKPVCEISSRFEGKDFTVKMRDISRGRQEIIGFEEPDIADVLYTGDRHKRLRLELMFPRTVAAHAKATGFAPDIWWLNESHTSFLYPFVQEERAHFGDPKFLFTIHSPEFSVMERFYHTRYESLGIPETYRDLFVDNNTIDLTRAAMRFAHRVNAVSAEHGRVTREMFPDFAEKITHVTNGTDIALWRNPLLKAAAGLGGICDADALMASHAYMREQFLQRADVQASTLNQRYIRMDRNRPTAAFVRRFQEYKQLWPMLEPILCAVCAERGTRVQSGIGVVEGLGMNVIGAGRAPEEDNTCMWWMQEFYRVSRNGLAGRFVFFDYNLDVLTAGVQGADLWIVTPRRTREACGTSDRDAAHNSVPSVSTSTGGMMEWMREFDPATGEGNGFIIEPYGPAALYREMKKFSDLWYAWHDRGDQALVQLKQNVLAASPALDIRPALTQYADIFRELVGR